MTANNRICKLILPFLLGVGLLTAGCADVAEEGVDNDKPRSGYLTLKFNISGTTTRTSSQESPGEDQVTNKEETYLLNENKFSTVDLFFYDADASEDDVALLHHRIENISENQAEISLSSFNEVTTGSDDEEISFKVYAVANCAEAETLDKPSLNELKAQITQADAGKDEKHAFRAAVAPEDFVMTNFSDTKNTVTFKKSDETVTASITFRRLAAKIRLALDVKETLEDGDVTWTAVMNEIRLYISNGVRKARLDGDASQAGLTYAEELDKSDYFNIQTSGSTSTEDYGLARLLTEHEKDILGQPATDASEKYTLYNTLPYYTYPNTSNEALLEPHQTMLTFVVPWKGTNKNGDDPIYKPTYYTVPVKSGGDIVSNAYYCLRAHVGMMGSSTPERPLQIEAKSEIAEWGTAKETDADIRELRFLQFNKTEFTLNNVSEIEIPYRTTHDCILESVKVTYYSQKTDNGKELSNSETYYSSSNNQNETEISANTTVRTFTCTLDNDNNIVTFNHEFNKSGEYSRYDVVITVRHYDVNTDSEFSEKINLHTYPAIFVTSENIDDIPGANDKTAGAFRNNDGWILVNGYGTGDSGTGNLGNVTCHVGNSGDTHSITTFTVTQLSETDKKQWGWIIDDPRTYYINNLSDNAFTSSSGAAGMKNDDVANKFETWTNYANYGGPYDGTKKSGATNNSANRWNLADYDVRTIWEWYTGEDWTIEYIDENGDKAQWNAKTDKKRKLRYYYPTSVDQEREKVIAPKFSIVSIHAYDAGSNDDGIKLAARKCAAYQQFGYPAGRWRLPTYGEIQFIKKLQANNKILDVFGGSQNWSATGVVSGNGSISRTDNTGYVRCVYDNWYWERYDNNGNTMNRIPKGETEVDYGRQDNGTITGQKTVNNWTIFTWGDRPKENVLTTRSASGRSPEVERWLEEWQGIH